MPSGVQMWDNAGNLVLDTNTRVGRILGSISVSGASNPSGSVSNAFITQGEVFYFQVNNGAASLAKPPDVSVSGTTISWSGTENGWSGFIFYGVY